MMDNAEAAATIHALDAWVARYPVSPPPGGHYGCTFRDMVRTDGQCRRLGRDGGRRGNVRDSLIATLVARRTHQVILLMVIGKSSDT